MRRLSTAEDVLRDAVERFDRIAIACSFQKEASVIMDMLSRIEPKARFFILDTGVLFPETYAIWKQIEDRYGVKVEVHDATGPWTGPENCCSAAKVGALERALAGADAWITGIRREQSPTRADAQPVEWDEKRSMWKYNPLADWTERDVWAYIAEHDLPYNELHDRGYASIGCTHCTRPGAGREGRWAGLAKTECGLHA